MLAKDINSNPTQYRTWIVSNYPDLDGYFYYGPKSGTNPLIDITAYAIEDNTLLLDFNLPLASSWEQPPPQTNFPILKTLPSGVEDAQLAVIDGYVYLFGGKVSSSIYQANINNPATWVDTGANLPTTLYGASLAIVNGTIYLFGGNNGTKTVANIYTASVSNPLNWTDHGALLPVALQYSSLGMQGGSLYLFGGQTGNQSSNVILSANISNPLSWINTGSTLPSAVYGSSLAQVDGYWMLYGGQFSFNTPTSSIWRASISTPTNWSLDGYLPYATSFSQFITVGDDGYLIGPMVGSNFTGFTPIISCYLGTPNIFTDTGQVVPGNLSHSQIAMIADRIWLFGGSGESAIFACNQLLKYNYYDTVIQAYSILTRSLFPMIDNFTNPFQALCFPWWKSDYSMSPPITPPVVPPPI